MAGGSGSKLARKPAGDSSGRGEVLEPSPRSFAWNVAAAAKSLGDDDNDGDKLVDKVNNIIGTFRSTNGSINQFGSGALDLGDLAINKDSKILGIGHDLLPDPTVGKKEMPPPPMPLSPVLTRLRKICARPDHEMV